MVFYDKQICIEIVSFFFLFEERLYILNCTHQQKQDNLDVPSCKKAGRVE